jgi:hypothetical protein
VSHNKKLDINDLTALSFWVIMQENRTQYNWTADVNRLLDCYFDHRLGRIKIDDIKLLGRLTQVIKEITDKIITEKHRPGQGKYFDFNLEPLSGTQRPNAASRKGDEPKASRNALDLVSRKVPDILEALGSSGSMSSVAGRGVLDASGTQSAQSAETRYFDSDGILYFWATNLPLMSKSRSKDEYTLCTSRFTGVHKVFPNIHLDDKCSKLASERHNDKNLRDGTLVVSRDKLTRYKYGIGNDSAHGINFVACPECTPWVNGDNVIDMLSSVEYDKRNINHVLEDKTTP